MITEPKIEDRNDQHYVGIRTQVTVQEMGPVLPPLWGGIVWLVGKQRLEAIRCTYLALSRRRYGGEDGN